MFTVKFCQLCYIFESFNDKNVELLQLNSIKTSNLIQKWTKDLSRHLPNEDMQLKFQTGFLRKSKGPGPEQSVNSESYYLENRCDRYMYSVYF